MHFGGVGFHALVGENGTVEAAFKMGAHALTIVIKRPLGQAYVAYLLASLASQVCRCILHNYRYEKCDTV